MPQNITPVARRYYPRLSEIVTVEDLPEFLSFVQEGLNAIFDKIHYKNLQYSKSYRGDAAFYSLDIVSKEPIGFTIPGGLRLVLNPNADDTSISSFPVMLEYQWEILAFLRSFNLQNFSFTVEDFYQTGLKVFRIDENQVVAQALNFFTETSSPSTDKFQQIQADINEAYPGANLTFPADPTLETVISSIQSNPVLNQPGTVHPVSTVMFNTYINNVDLAQAKVNLQLFFNIIVPEGIEDYIKRIIRPKARAALTLRAGIEFPRNYLQPVYGPEGENPFGTPNPELALEVIPATDADGDPKVILLFSEAVFYADTEQGLGYSLEFNIETNTYAQIGNTGLIIFLDNLKIDLSKDTNIPEADLDGRPADFVGVYAEQLSVILPKKWFKSVQENTTLQIVAKTLLIGTGGVSGTIALETIDTGNPPGQNDILWIRIGSDSGFKVGFSLFDITFKQDKVVYSKLRGALQIEKFKYPEGHMHEDDTVTIMIDGSLEEDGGFELTATVQDYPIRLPGVFVYHLKTLGLKREGDGDFYLKTSGTLEFIGLIREILNISSIEIDMLRIYSDGSMEFSGGGINLVEPIVIPLGPADITITAIHYGSHQKEINDEIVKFNFFGFDGGLSVDPLGVEIRGDGIKYYYSNEHPEHNYLHIQTIYLDLTIPASTPVAIIRGWLSIPEPGTSPEYAGGVTIDLPRVKITGSAGMKLAPRYPAFLIDASIEFPAPIPLGTFAIYGFRGLLGYRYLAEKEETESWYDYYKRPPRGIHAEKFSGPNQTADAIDAFSIGAGASLGTSFDNGTVINLKAMVLLSVPSLFMIDGRATVLSTRLGLEDTKDPPFFANAYFAEDSFGLGFGADFKMPTNSGSTLKLYADVQAVFFFNDSSKWHVHIGTDKNPVTAEILNLVTLKSYLMLSARGIQAGARGELNFNRTYAGIIRVRAWAYIEIGGKISFDRPQFGAYLDAGVGADIDVKFVHLSAAFQILFGVEASEPFLIYGRVRISISIRIIWVFKFSFDAEVEVMWEQSKKIDIAPINPFTKLDPTTHQHVISELVKGVNMLSNETFTLAYLGAVIPTGLHSDITQKIIPVDTYIDIKTDKGLLPGGISDKVGGYTNPPSRHTDLIPPDKVIRGKELRQVKHQYSIESLEVKIWNPIGNGGWEDYHPYEALYPNDAGLNSEKIGQFQKTDGQYNTVRLLATTPFSYTEQGQPGWYIPEQYGLTAGSIFCEAEQLLPVCANFLNKPLHQQYYCFDNNHMFYSNEAAFLLIDKEDDEYAYITDHPNIHNFDQSLAFSINNKLQIILPEPSVIVKLKLTTDSMGVRVRYFSPRRADSALEVQYGNPNPGATNQNAPYTVTVSAANLNQVLLYNKPGWRAVTKIIIEPVQSMPVLLTQANNNLIFLQNQNLLSSLNLGPQPIQSLIPLQNELAYLKNTQGTLASNSYAFNIANNEFLVTNKSKDEWVTSWDVKLNSKITDNVIGFNVIHDTIFIESDYQITDIKLLPDFPGSYSISNDGFKAQIVTKDITQFITTEGNLELEIVYYENCRKDYNLCRLHRQLAAIKSTRLKDPAVVSEQDLKGIGPYVSQLLDIFSNFNNANPDYEFRGIYEQQLLNITNFLQRPTVLSYADAHIGISMLLTDLAIKGNCNCTDGCIKNKDLCALYKTIQGLLNTCIIVPSKTKESDLPAISSCVETLLTELYNFDKSFPGYDIVRDFGKQLEAIIAFTDNRDVETYEGAYIAMQHIITHLALEGNCDCGAVLQAVEDLHTSIKEILDGHILIPVSGNDFSGFITHVEHILEIINDFNIDYPGLDLPTHLEGYINILIEFLTTPNQGTLDNAIIAIGGILEYLNELGGFQVAMLSDTTLLHEVCWLSLESYQYNQNIPPQAAISEDVQATIEGIERFIQPVWRPNSSYVVRFVLKDTVDDWATPVGHPFSYTYGFTTAGPIGYFHKHANANYGSPDPDSFALTSLRRYIDYDRSYPNADGNLLSAKPMFYNDSTTQIYLFFTKAYAVHFFDNWQAYGGNEALSGRLKIVIKDPVEGIEIENPPYLDYDESDITTINIPQTVEQWLDDDNPLLNNAINSWINLYNSNNCIIVGAEPIKPASQYLSVELKHLKPNKLYTAIVNNLFAVGPNSEFTGVNQTEEVHRFVFQTSRYADFQAQVQSYKLAVSDDGIMTQKDAIFTLRKDFTAQQIEEAFKTIIGQANPGDNFILNYQHAYDRIFEGILGFIPLDPPISTEFNIIRNSSDSDKVVAVMIRNPEPFNIPKMPLQDMIDTIQVYVNGEPAEEFKVLHSKDYSQLIIMHSSYHIHMSVLDIKFKFKIWDGYNYTVSDIQSVQIDLVD